VRHEFDDRAVPRPPYWGGYRIVPTEVELWEGRPDRLHHRVRYRRSGDGWHRDLLWP
jgi:pyridoxamine 5'-phosphate oxidase